MSDFMLLLISDLILYIKMDEKACVVETDALLRCWKINGAENVDETHPCLAAEQAYLSCVGKNVC